MRNPVKPRSETAGIVEFSQILVRLEKHVLRKVERIFPIPHEPQNIVEDTFLPSRHQQIVGVDITPAGLDHQVTIFDFPKDQRFGSVPVRRQVGRKRREGVISEV
jgi:hypothetical protein